ncbi:septation protein SepH [Candidatus Mycobacterium wuenschmannii]|uniref:Septation protein SepH n=1 Tax=Candidatus Mycobacterium wuenschmannii TaxID=3027808 RepID=A0ABY8VSJ3_9MYCO|nr:septation protein SepH [Candidatus Mycobacterium wuenschmannii]WIM85975.1 septation protein SepH [Candidatus Mycobacterium wuenschmannii]
MRELKIVGLDLDGKHIICEGDNAGDKYKIRIDDRLRAAVRGDGARVNQTHIDIEASTMLRPKDIQARIRAGASVEQLAESAGVDVARVERFAHPVLLERARAAELATAAHPVLADGPAVLTLLETVTSALVARGLNPDSTTWDAWRNEDGRWTVQLGWKAGRSDNLAHFRFCPGSHGGTVTAVDDAASELIDPDFDRPLLRPVAPLAQLDFEEAEETPAPAPVVVETPEPEPKVEQTRARRGKGKPAVPAWEDVLLGVRSSGQR